MKSRLGAAAVAVIVAVTLLGAAARGAVFEGPRVALVIGNGVYDSLGALANPVNDAQAIADALRRLDFQVIELINADREDMLHGVQTFNDQLTRGSLALFYYAGHGVQLDGQNYILPVSAQLQRDTDVLVQAINAADVVRVMEGAQSRLNLVVLDACRNNPFVSASRSRSVSLGLAAMSAGASQTLIAYATSPGAVADDGDAIHSPYTSALLQVIEEPGLEVGMMFRHVRRLVRESTGGAQIPWTSGTLEDQFHLRAPIWPDPELYDDVRLEQLSWQVVQELSDPQARRVALEQFLNLFPDGRFTVLARLQLANMSGAGDVALTASLGALAPGGDVRVPLIDAPERVLDEAELNEDERLRVQRALRLLGYYDSAIDAVFGPGTQAAIGVFQRSMSEPSTGRLTEAQRLQLAVAAADAAAEGARLLAERARAAAALGWEAAADGDAESAPFEGGVYRGHDIGGETGGYGVIEGADGGSFAGLFSDGLPILGVRLMTNGDHFEGELADGRIQGMGVYYRADGSRVEGQWRTGAVDGFAVSVSAADVWTIGEWRAGAPDGYAVSATRNGAISRGVWVEGGLVGRF